MCDTEQLVFYGDYKTLKLQFSQPGMLIKQQEWAFVSYVLYLNALHALNLLYYTILYIDTGKLL